MSFNSQLKAKFKSVNFYDLIRDKMRKTFMRIKPYTKLLVCEEEVMVVSTSQPSYAEHLW